ncbi:translation elongation factor Tu [human gut metagenome]|uniref:Translation elongation factor Tu n=1 Tax=human gut metagenome TaxID=408170 RepID=K1SUP2_9ZZZZ
MEVRDLLSEYGFPGDEIPVIKGSSLKVLESTSTDPNAPEYQCMKELMDAVDSYIPTPERPVDQAILNAYRRCYDNNRSWYSCYRKSRKRRS